MQVGSRKQSDAGMSMIQIHRNVAAALLIAALPLAPAQAQQGAVVFKHFHAYPKGQWQQVMTSTRGGVSMGPPITQTVCLAPLDTREAAAAAQETIRMANAAASNCTMRALRDEESTAEYEQVCALGPGQQRMHSTMRVVDDRTIDKETRMTIPGVPEMVIKTRMSYEGPCSTQAAAPQIDCAEVAEMREQMKEAPGQCAQLPAPYKEQCDARLGMVRQMVAAQAGRCH